MEGMTKTEIERITIKEAARGKATRPRDAATLIVLDRGPDERRVLMGRRHPSHAFMPGKLVFPGGRTDPGDSRVPAADQIHPADLARLTGGGSRTTPSRARAIAFSALREAYEEAGILIGSRKAFSTTRPEWDGFVRHGVTPMLGSLRLIARAITPPGRVRRFDARFFAAWRRHIAVSLPLEGPENELEELVWVPISEAIASDVPKITKVILEELVRRLEQDPDLEAAPPIPFYRMRNNRMERTLL